MAVKEVHGPGPRGARGPRPKVENPGKLLRRIMDEAVSYTHLYGAGWHPAAG